MPSLDISVGVGDQRQQAEIEGVTVEDPAEALGDDGLHAKQNQHFRCLLPAGADTEIAARDNDIAGLNVRRELKVDGFEAMFRQLLHRAFHIGAGREQVGIDIVAVFPGFAAHDLFSARKGRGSATRPRTAVAATV